MGATREDTLRKVRALLAKEHAPGTTPAEVAAALAMATRLMERDGLTRAALEVDGAAEEPDEDVREFRDPLDAQRGNVASWRGRLAMVLGEHCACQVYQSRGLGLMLVGRPSDADTLRYLFAYCAREIDSLTREHCAGEGRTYANNFRIGCVDAIARAVRAERAAERDAARAAAQTSTALVLVDRAIQVMDRRLADAQRYGREKLNLRSRSASAGRADWNARAHGSSAGASIYPGGKRPGIGSGPRGYIGS